MMGMQMTTKDVSPTAKASYLAGTALQALLKPLQFVPSQSAETESLKDQKHVMIQT